jgi:hypothetical protein
MKFKERYRTLVELYRNRYSVKSAYQKRSIVGLEKQWLNTLSTEGAVIIPGYLSTEECEVIKASIDSSLEDFRNNESEIKKGAMSKFGWELSNGTSIWHDDQKADQRVFKSEKIDERILKFNQSQSLIDIGSSYLEVDLKILFTMANRLTFKENNSGSRGGWHRDMVYKKGFKAMIYLTDVDEKSGPFQYLPGSAAANFHLAKVLKVDQYQFTNEEVMGLAGSKENIITCTGEAGTLLLFETNMIHRGKPIENGMTRYAMTNYYNR